MKTIRLDKLLARQGFGSRRDTGRLIRSGQVRVNGAVCTKADAHIEPLADTVTVADVPVALQRDIYLMMNKRAGVVCSRKDSRYESVFDSIREKDSASFSDGALHTVGRLDADTEGLLLLTTDGALTHRLISPKNHIAKTYEITLERAADESEQRRCAELIAAGIGIARDGPDAAYVCRPAQLAFRGGTHCTLVITEGRYHQVKRMIAACGNGVAYLKRTALGPLVLDESLAPGEYRALTEEELAQLQEL